MFMALLRNGGFGFGGDGAGAATQGIETQAQLNAIRGDLFLQNCKDTAELRNGQRDLGFAITQGFSSTAFQGRTTLPTSVTINQLGMTQGLIKIVCGKLRIEHS